MIKNLEREYTVLEEGKWQLVLTKKLWDKARITCGFNYATHKIYLSTGRGTFCGSCKCGGMISGELRGK